MLRSNSVRFSVWGGLSALLAMGILACAGSGTHSADSGTEPDVIADVIVESGAKSSTVTLLGLREPVFTAFQQSGPDRVIVDLAGVDSGAVGDPISVYDGTIQEITVSPYATGSGDAMTRVEITLASPVDYEVWPSESGLVVELETIDGDSADMGDDLGMETAATDDPWSIVPVSDEAASSDESDFDAASMDDAATLAGQARSATTLTGIEAKAVGQGSLIHLQANGRVESAATFTLEDPARLVVDLPGMSSSAPEGTIELGSAQAQRVRIGVHADKIRIVIDGADAPNPFDGRQVIPVASGLVIALGSGSELEDAVAMAAAASPSLAQARITPIPEAPQAITIAEADSAGSWDEPAATTTPAAASVGGEEVVTIYGVEFDVQDGRDRIVVLGEHPVDYLVYEPDPETVVLSLEGAVIDPEAAVRITPEAGGPVSLVTAFDQPEVSTPEVRIVVKRAANLRPEVSRRGSLLIVDFPRTGQMASAPPVSVTEGSGSQGLEGETTLVADGSDLLEGAAAPESLPIAQLNPLGDPAAPAPLGADLTALDAPAGPAGIEPPASISILREGGLMDGKEYVGRRISLDFKDVEVADVLRLIAEVSDLNVIAGDEVKGAVTIRLVDVPWDQALDVILLTKGLGFVRIGNVLRIASAGVLSSEEELRLQERRAKEKLEDLVVKLQPVNYADVGDVSGMVTQLLTPRGSVNTDSRTNTLIIKDIASVIDEATALVKAVDTMTPQVMIEAKIVEAGLEFSREFGSVWTFGTNPATESALGGRDYTFNAGEDNGVGDGFGNNVVFGNPITANPTGMLNLAATVLNDRFNYEVQLQAAEVNGDGKVISSPRIVTLDNSEASIEQGVSIPFQTFENGDAQLEFVDAVLQLRVTPHITSDKSIIMDISVSRNAPDDSVFTLTGSPAIAKNQVKTETLVKDGQTLVLGGIYVVDKSERESRVPYLHKVPFLGALFRSNEFSDSRKELLIFVTPRIVVTPTAAS